MRRAKIHQLFVALTAIGTAVVLVFIAGIAVAPSAQIEQKETAGAPAIPSPPKASTFAPAKDLANQLQEYMKEIEATLESEQEYKDSEGKIGRCASTLSVIALCLGMHDEKNEYMSRAPALIKAAEKLAATTDYQSAIKAFDAVKAAAASESQAQPNLKWEKVASLPDLMKQVPNINTKLKRNIKGTKFKSKAKDTAAYTAAIAAIAQGSIADTSKVKNPDDIKKWFQYMIDMRDAAGAANAAIRASNQSAANEAMLKLAKSCDDCHTVFHPEAKLKETEESE